MSVNSKYTPDNTFFKIENETPERIALRYVESDQYLPERYQHNEDLQLYRYKCLRCHHDFGHAERVAKICAALMAEISTDHDDIYAIRIAALLHDTGYNRNKHGHAHRGAIYAHHYFQRHHLTFPRSERVIKAIWHHSVLPKDYIDHPSQETIDPFILVLNLADKLDLTYERVTPETDNWQGDRQMRNIISMTLRFNGTPDVTHPTATFNVNFYVNDKFNEPEFRDWYHFKKTQLAVQTFAKTYGYLPRINFIYPGEVE